MVRTTLILGAFYTFGNLVHVYAECPNGCSGNGRCSNYEAQFSTGMEQNTKVPSGYLATYGYDTNTMKKDSCTCFTKTGFDGSEVYAYTGADCSLKTCPYGPAFAYTPGADNDHTSVIECSGQGTCDRSSGNCQCFDGYTGYNCGRTECPNDCSGNGLCISLRQMATDIRDNDGSFQFPTANVKYSTAFDAKQQRVCSCDKNYMGPDCSILQCPSTSDPMGGKGSEYGRDCSGRGSCQDNGNCECFTGFFGTQCEKQRANVM
eukprot:snap_masked-scaffold_10-processed-gene-10.9-mRNA-1 protein AED:0.22 eAED:0.22 QI:0/-1/0/1/-1/1/1/0/261